MMVVAFRIGDTGFAVPVDAVSEVTTPRVRVRVPYAPAVIWGVINHRGSVYAAVDACLWVSNGAVVWKQTPIARAILLDPASSLQPHRVALLVDAIEAVGLAEFDEETGEENVARVEGIRVEILDVSGLMRELDRMIEHVVRSRAMRRGIQDGR